MIPGSRFPQMSATSAAEVDGTCDPASHSFHPEIHTWEVGRNVVTRNDHLAGKRLVITVAGPIEVSPEDDGGVAGYGGLGSCGSRAFERRTVEQFRRVPSNALVIKARARIVSIDAHAQGTLPHGVDAREASARVDETRVAFVAAATRQKYLPGREAADRPVETKPNVTLRPCVKRWRERRRRGACVTD